MHSLSKTLKPVAGAFAISTLAFAAAAPAQAITFSFGGALAGDGSGLTTNVVGAQVVDFNSIPDGTAIGNNDFLPNPPSALPFVLPNGTATYSAPERGGRVGRVVIGSVPGRFRAPGTFVEDPALDPGPDNETNYLTLGARQERGPVRIDFAGVAPLDYFGLYWGSIDLYNSISFFRGGSLVRTIGGGELLDALNQNPGNFSQYINFFATRQTLFDRIELISGDPALETDNHAFRVVPTPALVPAALGFGAAMLRKRKGEQKEASGAEA